MVIRDISGGKVSGTGTLDCESGLIGGLLISLDTTLGVIVLRDTNSTGAILVEISPKTAMFVGAPIKAAKKIYYSISGSGCAVQIFEWVE